MPWPFPVKASEGKRRKPHAGAHRPLHPNPTAKRDVFASSCQHCGAFFLDTPLFVCEAYDHHHVREDGRKARKIARGVRVTRNRRRMASWPRVTL